MYQSDCKELFLRIFLWPKIDDKARVLSHWAFIFIDDSCVIIEVIKILLVHFKFLLPTLEHWRIDFPHRVGEFLVSAELKHDSLDEIQYYNNVLVTIVGFIFSIPSQIGEKNLRALYVKNCECQFHILFQNFLSVSEFFILASRIPFWIIFSAVLPASNAEFVGTDSIGFDRFLTAYCMLFLFF